VVEVPFETKEKRSMVGKIRESETLIRIISPVVELNGAVHRND
jgi:hypothetical protein